MAGLLKDLIDNFVLAFDAAAFVVAAVASAVVAAGDSFAAKADCFEALTVGADIADPSAQIFVVEDSCFGELIADAAWLVVAGIEFPPDLNFVLVTCPVAVFVAVPLFAADSYDSAAVVSLFVDHFDTVDSGRLVADGFAVAVAVASVLSAGCFHFVVLLVHLAAVPFAGFDLIAVVRAVFVVDIVDAASSDVVPVIYFVAWLLVVAVGAFDSYLIDQAECIVAG